MKQQKIEIEFKSLGFNNLRSNVYKTKPFTGYQRKYLLGLIPGRFITPHEEVVEYITECFKRGYIISSSGTIHPIATIVEMSIRIYE